MNQIRILSISLLIFILALSTRAQNDSGIAERVVEGNLRFLASKELRGREAGTPWGYVAGEFLASRLFTYGLQPLLNHTDKEPLDLFYQEFEMSGTIPARVQLTMQWAASGSSDYLAYPPAYSGKSDLKNGKDLFYFYNSPRELNLRGAAVFAGYAIQAPEYHYNDFAGLEISGKIVVAFYGEPLEQDSLTFFNGKHLTHYGTVEWKAREVARRGGELLVLIPTPENQPKYQRFLQRQNPRRNNLKFVLKNANTVPVVYLSAEVARALFKDDYFSRFTAAEKKLRQQVLSKTNATLRFPSLELQPYTWKVELKIPEQEERTGRNVLAVLPGSDPDLKNEYILIGSHYDHEGVKEGKIYRGADDNASGVTVNLAVAQAYASLAPEKRPWRSVIFAFWDAEEKGLLGSRYFVQNPPIPLESIRVAFNMDMIGRDASFNFAALRRPMTDPDAENKVMLFYSAQAPLLKELAEKANRKAKLHLLFDPNVFFTSGSDHTSFHPNKIPVIYYFTGFHTDYTSPNDVPDKIDFNKLTRIARHIFDLSRLLATEKTIPRFDTRILTAPEGDFKR